MFPSFRVRWNSAWQQAPRIRVCQLPRQSQRPQRSPILPRLQRVRQELRYGGNLYVMHGIEPCGFLWLRSDCGQIWFKSDSQCTNGISDPFNEAVTRCVFAMPTPHPKQVSVSDGWRPEEESSFWKISAERSRMEGEQADFQSLTPSQIKSIEKGEKPLPSYLRQVGWDMIEKLFVITQVSII